MSRVWFTHRCLESVLPQWLALGWTEVARVPVLSLGDHERDVLIEWLHDRHPVYPRGREMKPRFDLIPHGIERAVAAVFAATANERDGDEPGWRTRSNEAQESYAALRRHLDDYRNGVTADKDSGQHPLAHVIARAMILFDLERRKQLK